MLAWTLLQSATQPNPRTQVSTRLIPPEPLYIIANLGISLNFGAVDFDRLAAMWPVHMEIESVHAIASLLPLIFRRRSFIH